MNTLRLSSVRVRRRQYTIRQILGALLPILLTLAGCTLTAAEETEEHQTLLAKGHAVHVNTRNGRIEVRTGTGQKVKVKAVKRARAGSKPEVLLKEIRVKLTPGADRLTISADHPKGSLGKQYGVSFFITVPPATAISAETRNGAVRVEEPGARVKVDTRNGSVNVTKARDEVEVVTRNGAITLSGRPRRFSLESSNGAIRVTLDAGAVLQGASKARTRNGAITLVAPASFQGRIEAGTKNGRVKSDFPLGGTFPPGSPTLELRTRNGSVRIRKP